MHGLASRAIIGRSGVARSPSADGCSPAKSYTYGNRLDQSAFALVRADYRRLRIPRHTRKQCKAKMASGYKCAASPLLRSDSMIDCE
jgi:hypothetical protein